MIPSRAIPSRAIPSRAIPSHLIPSHVIPNCAIPSRAIPPPRPVPLPFLRKRRKTENLPFVVMQLLVMRLLASLTDKST